MTTTTTTITTTVTTPPRTVVLVEGTWGGDWAKPGSAFRAMLEARGFTVLRFEGWTENIGGVPNLLSRGKDRDWWAGGYALGYLLKALALCDRNVICHSHGIGPVLYQAATAGQLPINRLVSVCSPVRADLQDVANNAIGRIGRWRHIASANGDFMQWAGELFDGHIQLARERRWHQAHENLIIPGIGHSKLLNDDKFIGTAPSYDDGLWSTDGMLDFLRGGEPTAPATEAACR
jgi:hypothetical protein